MYIYVYMFCICMYIYISIYMRESGAAPVRPAIGLPCLRLLEHLLHLNRQSVFNL